MASTSAPVKPQMPLQQPVSTEPETDREQVEQTAKLFMNGSSLVEVRALNAARGGGAVQGILQGFFTDPALLVKEVNMLSEYDAVWFTLNPVDKATPKPADQRFKSGKLGGGANAAQIVCRRWLLVDVDPIKPESATSASGDEKQATKLMADDVAAYLSGLGWPEPVKADSGNGHHLLYRIDLPADDGGLVESCLKALNKEFSDSEAKVDAGVNKACGLCKLYGTVARKGKSTEERPHRLSRLLYVPDRIEVVDKKLLEELAAQNDPDADEESNTKTTKKSLPLHHGKQHHNGSIDLDAILKKQWPDISGPESYIAKDGQQARKWVWSSCPVNPEHSNKSAYIIQFSTGAIVARCHHDSCQWQWRDLRGMYSLTLGTLPDQELDQFYFADQLADHFHDKLKYSSEQGLLVYDGKRFMPDAGKASDWTQQMIKEAWSSLADEDNAELVKVKTRRLLSMRRNDAVRAVIALAKDKPQVRQQKKDFDAPPLLVNCLNGTYCLETQTLRPHSPADLLTQIGGFDFDEAADCPQWEKAVEDICQGNAELIAFLQRAAGYSLTADTTEQKLFLCYGSGSNGKSTFLETLQALLGEYALTTPASTIMAKRNDSIPNDVARLDGARMVVAAETGDGRKLAETAVKQMTGGDTISARFLHREWFEFSPNFKLWIMTNHKPVIRGNDFAIWRRILLVPFNAKFAGAARDDKLKEKLKQELPGIFNWALTGYLAWHEKGLAAPEAVIAATDAYKAEMDTVSQFISDCCDTRDGLSETFKRLWSAYGEWCKQDGSSRVSRPDFIRWLNENGYTGDKASGNVAIRLGLNLRRQDG